MDHVRRGRETAAPPLTCKEGRCRLTLPASHMTTTRKKTSLSASGSDWVTELLGWFHRNQRTMPWRSDPSPYRVWISEIMLQQTQVRTVIPYFERFLRRFPSPVALAEADLQEVLKAWEGLGYYARARNLHHADRVILERHGGKVPLASHELQSLPGIGDYTAAAIASICGGEAIPVVDGNVLRVFARFWGIADDIRGTGVRKDIANRLAAVLPARAAGAFNQAIMELGALVCRRTGPDCEACPLRHDCTARREGRVTELPFKSPAKPAPHRDVAVGIVMRRGRVLIARRRPDQMLGGLWEFPGGKREGRESIADAVRRELREETGIEVSVGPRLCVVKHAYSHFRITLHAHLCGHVSGRARPAAADAVKWVARDDLDRYPFPVADRQIIELLQRNAALWTSTATPADAGG